jgi:hypothetical protein
MRLTVEERVFILESYLKTMSYVHCRQSFVEKFGRQEPVKSAIVHWSDDKSVIILSFDIVDYSATDRPECFVEKL